MAYTVFISEDDMLQYDTAVIRYDNLAKDAMQCLADLSLMTGKDVLIRERYDDEADEGEGSTND